MKFIRKCARQVVVCGIALAVLASATELSAQSAKPGKVTVTSLRGQARYSTDNRTWHPVKVGLVLKPGSIIQTAGGVSSVGLVLGEHEVVTQQPAFGAINTPSAGGGGGGRDEQDANIVVMAPDTILAIDKLTVEETGADVVSETQLDLRAGKITGNVKKLSAASRYEIKFPTGVAGVRGTIYTIDKNGVTQVLAGSVVVSYLKNGVATTQVVMGGFQFDPATGLVTPIPDFNQKDMIKDLRAMGGGQPNTPPTSYTVDHTIYYVSPTIGHNGLGGGGGPQ